jgi:uncharacterized protein YdiU (UPF0061 family)
MHDTIDSLPFDNRFTRELPADPDVTNAQRQVIGACYSRVTPKCFAKPLYVAHSPEVASDLGLSEAACRDQSFAEVLAGNRVLADMDPHAMCYGGHQFGNWAGQLGDGRAINLGEVVTPGGEIQMLQLKGAGPTPYSRTADGLAVLRSSLREFLCSEAMFHLGAPTTRALSLVLTGEEVIRDMFYDGRAALEPGAVVCRVAPSFLRFGNYEILASTQQVELLRQLTDFTIRTLFPDLLAGTGTPTKDTYLAWFNEVCRRTAEMCVHWQRVGFVHGVMNTDNMSILGLTIDYGPYGWIENYDENWTPNTTDAQHHRYRFGTQGLVAQWNLAQLANALVPLVEETEPLQEALDTYGKTFDDGWRAMMGEKLGLAKFDPATDEILVTELLEILAAVETDMTVFYRRLSAMPLTEIDGDPIAPLLDAYYVPDQLTAEHRARTVDWLRSYAERVRRDGTSDLERRERMDAVNPTYVLRNYLAQLAIDKAETGDFRKIQDLLQVLRHPYDEQSDQEEFAAKRPDWARHRPGCSMLSCSS